jgi:hypothetical protein
MWRKGARVSSVRWLDEVARRAEKGDVAYPTKRLARDSLQ